ncbi:TPA: nuclear transport factor 2 family protein [Streptococcus suis]|uniref:nuclear transport factor 2 family protein n=1 Tax=Streptococcus suis TaxID=1307 RepID=UPI001ABE5C0A|nr:nuclear transport factor 2 family protein [Streptococcus suis]MBO4108991.1 nuclear transport factor 2 family protein [Streptococcus suis]HEM3614573.1 nuclear transport factor 2 family protein [Streptococcus suis]HEM3642963.1 nuclear transport factor 2 family protein [Streptococcus suis]
MTHREILESYMQAWQQKKTVSLGDFFTEDIYYSECYGPVYQGISEVEQWFEDWNQKGRVLDWTIQRVLECGQTLVAQWTFSCDYDGQQEAFDGVTIADFREKKMCRVLEYRSESQHTFPYRGKGLE